MLNCRQIVPFRIADMKEDAGRIAFVDVEVGLKDLRVRSIGALLYPDGSKYSGIKEAELLDFMSTAGFVCGHNIVHHDLHYLGGVANMKLPVIDTLYLSPLLFPAHPYCNFLKDDKLLTDQMNNPVNDCVKARDLLLSEVACWHSMDVVLQGIYCGLLNAFPEFTGFFAYVRMSL